MCELFRFMAFLSNVQRMKIFFWREKNNFNLYNNDMNEYYITFIVNRKCLHNNLLRNIQGLHEYYFFSITNVCTITYYLRNIQGFDVLGKCWKLKWWIYTCILIRWPKFPCIRIEAFSSHNGYVHMYVWRAF